LNRLEEFPNLIITQTMSKAYGMAGIRLGVCYASKEIISVLNSIKPPYNVNALTQQKAIDRLTAKENIQNEIQRIKTQKEGLMVALREIDFIERIVPSDANFLLIKVDNATKRYQQLIKTGIVVRNRSNQPLCENCLRVSVGTEMENEKLIESFQSISKF